MGTWLYSGCPSEEFNGQQAKLYAHRWTAAAEPDLWRWTGYGKRKSHYKSSSSSSTEQQPLLSFFNLKSSPRSRTSRRINKLTLHLFAFRYIEIVKIRDKFSGSTSSCVAASYRPDFAAWTLQIWVKPTTRWYSRSSTQLLSSSSSTTSLPSFGLKLNYLIVAELTRFFIPSPSPHTPFPSHIRWIQCK